MAYKMNKALEAQEGYDKGFDDGYNAGREYYINDICLEINNVEKSIENVRNYVHENDEVIDELQMTLRVLNVIKNKANSKKYRT